jgi:hypothetical protein
MSKLNKLVSDVNRLRRTCVQAKEKPALLIMEELEELRLERTEFEEGGELFTLSKKITSLCMRSEIKRAYQLLRHLQNTPSNKLGEWDWQEEKQDAKLAMSHPKNDLDLRMILLDQWLPKYKKAKKLALDEISAEVRKLIHDRPEFDVDGDLHPLVNLLRGYRKHRRVASAYELLLLLQNTSSEELRHQGVERVKNMVQRNSKSHDPVA